MMPTQNLLSTKPFTQVSVVIITVNYRKLLNSDVFHDLLYLSLVNKKYYNQTFFHNSTKSKVFEKCELGKKFGNCRPTSRAVRLLDIIFPIILGTRSGT